MIPIMERTLPSPMHPPTANTPLSTPIPATSPPPSSLNGSTMQVRKTSHKAAEQKRRDSLKTTYDDLRRLLPPIALPTNGDIDPNSITSPLFHPTAPLLPGALPPRGPPKAGGEGPNKGVSKLQLLICGNEYIRLLKARVDRRDDEIAKLRKEIKRLRIVEEQNGWVGSAAADDGEELDLEKDLDVIERMSTVSATAAARNSHDGTAAHAVDDVMDEGDDEGDE